MRFLKLFASFPQVGAKVTYVDTSGQSRTGVVQELARLGDVSDPNPKSVEPRSFLTLEFVGHSSSKGQSGQQDLQHSVLIIVICCTSVILTFSCSVAGLHLA